VVPGMFRESGRPILSRKPSAINAVNQAKRLQREAEVYYFAFKHPRVRWYARVVAVCCAGYVLSPIQLIPSYIPVIGFLDDFLVLFLGAKLLQRIIPREVLAECRQQADAAETRRKEGTRTTVATVAFVVIVAVWLLAAVGVSVVIARHISSRTAIAKQSSKSLQR
jgi:uncharacterized membrane protein YkvA (DUF1232 family)